MVKCACFGKKYYQRTYGNICKNCGFTKDCYVRYKQTHNVEGLPKPKIEIEEENKF